MNTENEKYNFTYSVTENVLSSNQFFNVPTKNVCFSHKHKFIVMLILSINAIFDKFLFSLKWIVSLNATSNSIFLPSALKSSSFRNFWRKCGKITTIIILISWFYMWFQILSCYRIRISDHNLGLINLHARLFSTKARKLIWSQLGNKFVQSFSE